MPQSARRIGILLALLPLLPAARAAAATQWTRIGGDAGMDKFSPADIAGPLQQQYAKRFYSTFSNDPSPGDYYYSSSIVIRDGTAAVFSADSAPHIPGDNFGLGLPLTFFNFATGQTTSRTTTPSIAAWSGLPLPAGFIYPSGRYSLHLGENPAEIDSAHYSQAVVWADDGRLYVRHGSDNAVTAAYTPQTSAWTRLQLLKASPNAPGAASAFEGDANGFLQAWGDRLLYRPGDTRQTSPYVAVDISPGAWAAAGTTPVGQWKADVGPDIPASPLGDYYSGLRYGDVPKVANTTVNGVSTGVSVVSGTVVTNAASPYQYAVQTQATNLASGAKLWSKTFASDTGGPNGFYTDTADYWRFLAADGGTYVMYTGATGAPRTLRALDMATGNPKWSMPLPAGTTEPLLASHGNSLYVVGDTSQMKLELDSGKVDWAASNSFPQAEGTYYVSDPLYKPMVLTDDTAWFIDGATGSASQSLVGISTSDGHVIQTIDLNALVAKKPGESLLCVNDLAAADGELTVLLGIRSTADPYPTGAPGSSNGIIYQDLYTFRSVPEPGRLSAVLALTALELLRRRKWRISIRSASRTR